MQPTAVLAFTAFAATFVGEGMLVAHRAFALSYGGTAWHCPTSAYGQNPPRRGTG
jgi:hypothetical protein